MKLAKAHERFIRICAEQNLDEFGIASELVTAPLLAAGLASCSGALDGAADDEQLLEALRHGWSLFNAGVITEDDWGEAVNDVYAALESECLYRYSPTDLN